MERYGVYLMCSQPRTGAIYTGMSGDIPGRAEQNAGLKVGGAEWALRYKTKNLVYYEIWDDYVLAREREEQLKRWKREWKAELVRNFNPAWSDTCGRIWNASYMDRSSLREVFDFPSVRTKLGVVPGRRFSQKGGPTPFWKT